MLRPSIFGESFLNDWNDWDNWMNFSFPDVEKKLYGKHAAHVMKTDIKEHDDGYELVVDLPGFKKDQVQVELKDGYLTISAEKGLEKDDKEKKGKYLRQEAQAVHSMQAKALQRMTFMENLRMVF